MLHEVRVNILCLGHGSWLCRHSFISTVWGQQRERKKIMTIPATARTFLCHLTFGLLCTFPTYAKDLSTNLLNIFYFEHAHVSAADCELRGFPTKSIHKDWLKMNASIHERISSEIIADFRQKGLSETEARDTILGVRKKYRDQSVKQTRLSDALCGAFRQYLSNISTLEESRYASTR